MRIVRDYFTLSLVAVLTGLLSGCTDVILSKQVTAKSGPGLVYALPKGNVQVQVQRTTITPDDVTNAKTDASKAATTLANTKTALATAKDQLTDWQGKLAKAGPAAKDELTKQVALAQATLDYLTSQVATQTTAAKVAKDKADALANVIGEWQQTATVTVLPVVPDPTARYVATFNHNASRDDDLKITVNNGMLASSTATSIDQTPSIIVTLAQAAAAIGAGPLPVPAGPVHALVAPPQPTAQCSSLNWVETFDPTNSKETVEALSQLTRLAPSIRLDVDGAHCTDIPGPDSQCLLSKRASSPAVPTNTAPADANGFVYRVPRQTVLTLASAKNFGVPDDPVCQFKAQVNAQSLIAAVPDASSAFVLPTHAGAFTTSNLDFAFKDGMPTSFGEHSPSEIAAIASIPIDIAKAFVSIPADLIKLRVDYDSQANALITAKTAELNAQLDQLKAQRALDAAKAQSSTPAPGTTP